MADDLWKIDFQGKLVFRVEKINKRLHVVLVRSPKMIPIAPFGKYLNGNASLIFYTPPDHIRKHITSRQQMECLADVLGGVTPADRIMVVMEWEKSLTTKD